MKKSVNPRLRGRTVGREGQAIEGLECQVRGPRQEGRASESRGTEGWQMADEQRSRERSRQRKTTGSMSGAGR